MDDQFTVVIYIEGLTSPIINKYCDFNEARSHYRLHQDTSKHVYMLDEDGIILYDSNNII